MSDEFDKEAEREKLRKKFAEDEQQREHTQRLSELLLQGATMTNRHCETCGDPIFRHEGREFCPTCHATEDGYEVPVETPTAAADEGSAAAESNAAGSNTAESNAAGSNTAESNAAGSAAGTDTAESASTAENADVAAPATAESPTPDAASEAPGDEPATGERADHTARVANAESAPPDADVTPPAAGSTGAAARRVNAGEVTAARDAVIETLTRFARAAAETDDPRRARERLAAAKEAAETLAALDR